MMAGTKQILSLYVDRDSQQWIALDADGSFWIVSSEDENP